MNSAVIQTKELSRHFTQGEKTIHVLNNVNIDIYAGEIIALVGPSGSGKSTLLQSIGLLDDVSSGEIIINGHNTAQFNDAQRTKIRRDDIGFVYQFHCLLPEFDAVENVAIPQIIQGVSRQIATEKAKALLTQLRLDHRFDNRPGILSGGEQQRVAIARALANDPVLLLADEPTGNLDPESSEMVFDMLVRIAREKGLAAVIATHNMDLARRMDRIMEIKNGRVMVY